jgi:hypothetical protein
MTVIYYMRGVIETYEEDFQKGWRTPQRKQKKRGLSVAKDEQDGLLPPGFMPKPQDIEPILKPENQAKKRKHRSPKDTEQTKRLKSNLE